MIRFLSIVVIIPIISFLLLSSAFAQKEANVWYFGEYAGIDFNSGSPVPLMNGSLGTTEGCSSISDSSGNVLFYTDGGQVWNQNHIQMPNGFGLLGSFSATQSALIVPKPNSDSLYYIFTVDDWAYVPAHEGLRYSIVDMSLQSGLGDLLVKNTFLDSPMTERITAVQHCNGIDVWVLSHVWGSDAFYAYLVTAAGISSPVISNVGSPHNSGWDFAGQLKASPDGSKLAVAFNTGNKFELFDFDNSTGVVSNPISLQSSNYYGAYGVEFSQDGTKLYGTTLYSNVNIYQFDLLAGSSIDIINSAWVVGTSDTDLMALQLGPDGKIYVARNYGSYLGVIEYPNLSGIQCNYIDTAVFLAGRICRGGLPNFVQSYFYKPSFSFAYNTCAGDSTSFAISNTIAIDSVIWNFDDSISGSLNSSALSSPSHIFNSDGLYNVSLIVYYNCRIDTVFESVIINSLPLVNTSSDTTLCIGDSVTLVASGGTSYLWNTGDTANSITVSPSSTTSYFVSATNSCGTDSISIIVTVSLPPSPVTLNLDICAGDSVFAGGNYQTTSGIYVDTLTAISGCDSVIINNLNVEPLPFVYAGSDTTIVAGGNIQLIGSGGQTYLWSPSLGLNCTNCQSPIANPTATTTYYLTVTDSNGCSSIDNITITVIPEKTTACDESTIFIPDIFSPNADGENDVLQVMGKGFEIYTFIIYDRWGEKVFETNDVGRGWDGTYKGVMMNPAVFVYYLETTCTYTGEKFATKGDITLVR